MNVGVTPSLLVIPAALMEYKDFVRRFLRRFFMRTEVKLFLALNRLAESDVKMRKSNGFKLIQSRDIECGSEHAYRLPLGFSVEDVLSKSDTLVAAVGAPVEIVDRGGAVVVRVVKKDFPVRLKVQEEHIHAKGLLIGYDRLMNPLYHPLNTHILVGGASGSGKTDAVRFWIWQLSRQGYDVRICDLKGFSFLEFERLPNVQVAKSLGESRDMLVDSVYELMDRQEKIIRMRSREIIKSFKPIVLIIDEAASLAPRQNQGKAKKLADECDQAISLFGQQAREPRMSMIYCTQRPSMDVINLQFRANVEAMVAFRCRDKENSKMIIGKEGAERISPATPGRCIYAFERDHNLQVPFVGDDTAWNKLLTPKVEVLHHGSSHRAEPQRIYIEGIVTGSDRDDHSAFSPKQFPESKEKIIQPIKGTRREPVGSVEVARQRESVVTRQKRATTTTVYADEISE